ncbi:hypothetical protein P8S54_09330 [Thiomicrospira sp. R3]|uniref:hypothetical protein n=1 Tax=Thiomicrospira sp. R3 TaxID=3035472 RepID=UPI00259BEC0F|nr:hypothetical protein [Thiomicrospira sp. R3]WFE68400.1 hypothetical protein P8S54_09330 [Thiomicrospira sp. R3]
MNIRVGRYLIYGLIDPRDRALYYIGKTHKRREWRLAEHIKHALENDQRPVYEWVRALLLEHLEPEIFVWKKISPDSSWREAEKEAISFWKNYSSELPYAHPPQTKKSKPTEIKRIALLNATNGG